MEKREKLEIDIELKDLFFEFLRKWRLIVCCALIGGIVLGAVAFAADVKRANTPVVPNVEVEVEEDVTAELNIDELEEVISAVQLKAQIDAKSQYISQSILMQINPFSTDKVILEYKISGADAQTALNSYQIWIENGGFLNEDVADEEKIYIGELVTADASGETFMVQVLHQDAEACAALASEVKKAFGQYTTSLTMNGVVHVCTLLQETTTVVADGELHQFQADYLDENIADQEELAKMKADMSADQVAAYLEMEREVFDRGETGNEASNSDAELQNPDTGAQPAKVSIDLKQVLLGMVLGAVLAVVYIFVAYLMTGKLRTVGEVEKLYGVKMLGVMRNTQQKKKVFVAVDKLVWKLEHGRNAVLSDKEEQQLVAASIYIQCQKYGTSTVYASGSKLANISAEIMNALKEELASKGITLVIGKDVTGNADALLDASKAGNVLLVEEKRVSAYKDILKAVQMCVNNHIRVLGVTVVE